jgi:membrane protein DedA with SNARE-associated domain
MLESLLGRFGLLAVVSLLLGAGLGLPFPEEATQIAGGVLVHQGVLEVIPTFAACWIGVVGGDFLWYLLARRSGPRILGSPAVSRVVTPARRAWIEGHLQRRAFVAVMISRHLSGFRLAAFALAATHGVPAATFVAADGLSAILSVSIAVSLGYFFSDRLSALHHDLHRVELALAVVVLGTLVALALRRRRPAVAHG